MKKEKFIAEVEVLAKKAKELDFCDYSGASSIITDFKMMAKRYEENLNPYILEHIHSIESDFDKSRKYSRESLKSEHWYNGINGLISDIESMDSYETNFPEEQSLANH